MLEFCVYKQTIKRMDRDTIVAGSVGYLELEVHFSNDWKGFSKTITFKSTSETISVPLNDDNRVLSSSGLNLSAGEWLVSVNGVDGDKKIPTCTTTIVVSSGGTTT